MVQVMGPSAETTTISSTSYSGVKLRIFSGESLVFSVLAVPSGSGRACDDYRPTPLEINPTKAPVTSEQRQYFLPVEKNVNGFQRPILIEDDAVAEESGPIEDHAVVMQ